jgi:transposase
MDKSLPATSQASPMDVARHYQRLLGLPDPWVVSELVENLAQQTIELQLSHDAKSRFACPHCQQPCPVYDHAPVRRWRHLDALQFRTFLTTRPPRINCAKHGICNVDLPWAQFHSRWTIDVEFRAIEALQACSSITAACRLLKMSWNMLQGIMKSAVEKGLERRSLKELRLLGLDEKSFLRGQSYISVCSDLDGRRVLEVSPGRTAEEAMVALEVVPLAQRGKIAAVAMDLSEACAKAVRNLFPKAAQVIDRYHVSALLNKALNAVRQSEHARLLRQGDDVLKGTRQLWLYGPENMSDAMLLRFEAIAAMNLQTSKAWQVKENFAGFWEQPNAEIGARYFENWSASSLELKLGPVSKVVKTLSHYLTGLLSYFVHRITNAMSEGFNSKIQSLKSAARGFRSFANYRIRILFFCGRLDMGRTPATAS